MNSSAYGGFYAYNLCNLFIIEEVEMHTDYCKALLTPKTKFTC